MVALDFRAQLAGNNTARDRVLALIRRYGADVVKGVMRRILDNGERAFLDKLARLPDGVWRDRTYVECCRPGDRRTHRVALTLIKRGDTLTFENDGTAGQDGAMNATYSGWRGAIMVAVTELLCWDQYFAVGGALRHIEFDPVPGTLVVNLGDMMQRWTNDIYVSNMHRVLNNVSGRTRHSAALFFNPDYYTRVECLPNCQSAERLLADLLPVFDDLERALAAFEQSDPETIADGVALVHRALWTLLEREGVAELDPSGEAFDPHRHEALLSQPSDQPEGTVIEVLQKDGRAPYASIGKAVGLSEAAVRQRVQRMLDAGVVQVVAVANPFHLGFTRAAMIGITVEGSMETVAEQIAAMPEIDYVVITAGSFDLLCEVVCESDDQLLTVLQERLRTIPEVKSTETFVYLKLLKQSYQWGTR